MILYEGADRVRGRGRFVGNGEGERSEGGRRGAKMEKRDVMREKEEKWEK